MIGVFGGTFDPIHHGHLRPALDCLQALALDQVRFVPLRVAVHRPQPVAPATLRLAMVESAIAGQPGFVADARELGRAGGSFSSDTLESLRAELGGERPLCLMVGGDAFAGFLDWHRPLRILELAHLVVMGRPGAAPALPAGLRRLLGERGCDRRESLACAPGGRILLQSVTALDISSTRIRGLIGQGSSPRYLLPDPVLALIEQTGVYTGARRVASGGSRGFVFDNDIDRRGDRAPGEPGASAPKNI
jgi:nicotinate-nucleotide adenylyltransferase